jgi:hypothetical protein
MPTVVANVTQESLFLAPILHTALSEIVPDALRTKRHPLKSGSINFSVHPNNRNYQPVDIHIEIKAMWDLARWLGAKKRTDKILQRVEAAIAAALKGDHSQIVAVELHLSMAAYVRTPNVPVKAEPVMSRLNPAITPDYRGVEDEH